jgi:hypothetical protein
MRATPTFRRASGGALEVTLEQAEVELLRWVLSDLRSVVATPPVDDALGSGLVTARLFPRAYLDPTEEDAEQQWQQLVHDDLVAARVAALDHVVGVLTAAEANRRAVDGGLVRTMFDADTESQFLTVLNDARLVLGTAADVTADLDVDDLDLEPGDPRLHLLQLYAYLSQLQDELVGVLLDDFPD